MTAVVGSFKRILVPVDFSPSSANALEFAVAFGSSQHAEIDVLHVWHSDLATSVMVAKERAKNALREFVASLGLQGDVTVRRRIDHGDPYLTIQNVMQLSGHDLVVVAGLDLGHANVESVASSVLSSAPCPVLFVPPNSRATRSSDAAHSLRMERVLVPLALAGQDLEALDCAERLPGAERATIEVLSTDDVAPDGRARLQARAPLDRREEHSESLEVVAAMQKRARVSAFDLVVLCGERAGIGGRATDTRCLRVVVSLPRPSLCLPG